MTSKNNPSTLRGTRSIWIRLWHWLDALAILGLLSTVLLRKTFLSWHTNSAFIETTLHDAGTTITPELAKQIAVGIREPMWDFHYIFGFTLAGLFVVRIILGLIPGQHPMFGGLRKYFKAPAGSKPSKHFLAIKAGYAIFYAMVTFMIVTGLSMYFKTELSLSKDLVGNIKELHELSMWFFAAFVVVHIVGVVVSENQEEPGLVSDMINGGEDA